MFKSLLRTLPSLTGNVTLACKITDVDIQKDNISVGYCREAELKPLQNYLFNKYVSVNLLSGSYEYDVSRYYNQYLDVFYKPNFEFTGNDFKLYDKLTENPDRNVNYEFGCKRISYHANGYMFEFFAPMYIDDISDLPDYFEIKLKINDHLEKKLRIQINDKSKKNFLYAYLNKYISKLDNLSIFYNDDLHSFIYHAINVDKGGFVKIQDNTINYVIDDQTTVNLFDKSLNKGFENNKLMMKQIIPISFMFNVFDLFDNKHKKIYNFVKIYNISGTYVKNGKEETLFDFDINYNEIFGNSQMNVYALPENRFDIYKYENKVLPIYNKWRLQLLKDKIYNTNLNVNYFNTYNDQYSALYMYDKELKEYNSDNENNDVYIKNNNVYISEDYLQNYQYFSFPILYKSILKDPNKFFNLSNWSTCINNYSFTDNLLFNLNNIFNQDYQTNIDYFNIFIIPKEYDESVSLYKNFNILAKNVYTYLDNYDNQKNNILLNKDLLTSENNIIHLCNGESEIVELKNNIYFLENKNFDETKKQYINLKSYNKYFKYSDIKKINKFENINFFDQNVDIKPPKIINGYIKIDNINYLSNFPNNILDLIYEQLYFYNSYVNKITKFALYKDTGLLNEKTEFYILSNFIDYYELKQYYETYLIEDELSFTDLIKDITIYEYNIISSNVDKIFKKQKKLHKTIYVDNYNLNVKTDDNDEYNYMVHLENDDIENFFETYTSNNKNYITLSIKNIIDNSTIDENIIIPHITQIKEYNHMDYVITSVHKMTNSELFNIYNKKHQYYMYVEDDMNNYDIGNNTYNIYNTNEIVYKGIIYREKGKITQTDINNNKPGITYEVVYLQNLNNKYKEVDNFEDANYYAYKNTISDERVKVNDIWYYSTPLNKPQNGQYYIECTYIDEYSKIKYYAWLTPSQINELKNINNISKEPDDKNIHYNITQNTLTRDNKLLHKIYNNIYKTEDEINYQKQLIENGYICFYDNENELYIDINEDNIYNDKHYDIVYVEDLSYKHEHMIEVNFYKSSDPNKKSNNIKDLLIDLIIKNIYKPNENKINIYTFIELINILMTKSIKINIGDFISIDENIKYYLNVENLRNWTNDLIYKLKTLNLFSNHLNIKNVLNFIYSDIDQNIGKLIINEKYDHIEEIKNDINNFVLDKIYQKIISYQKVHFGNINDNYNIPELTGKLLEELYKDRKDLFNKFVEYEWKEKLDNMKGHKIQLYEYYDTNELTTILKDELLNIDEDGIYKYYINDDSIKENIPIVMFNYNEKIYACVLIHQLFTNTNMTYNIDGINIIKHINSIDINDIITDESILKIMMPYLNKNLVSILKYTFAHNDVNNFCLYPNKYSIVLRYGTNLKTSIKDNEYVDSLYYKTISDEDKHKVYKLVDLKNKVKIQLYRYLNYITPIFNEVNDDVNIYRCKYKYEQFIDYGTDNIYNDDINIYNYSGVKCFYDNTLSKTYQNEYDVEYDFEYKHFNNNLFYNIQPHIEINIDKKFTYEQLLEYESNSIILKYFTNYIKKYSKNIANDKNLILFLFNKYKVSCETTPIHLDILKNQKLYNLKYIFELI